MISIIDMLIRIKNAQAAGKEQVSVPFSRSRFEIAKILKDSNFIQDFDRKKRKVKKYEHSFLEIKLGSGKPFSGLKILSKPSRHVYIKNKDIRPVVSGFGISFISTSKGILTGKEARKQNLGGELLAEVW